MSGPIFVRDAYGTPLMPTSAAYARKLAQNRKGFLRPHHAFTILQLSQKVAEPVLRPIVAGIAIHLKTAEIFLVAEGDREAFPLLHVIIDLKTDLGWRIRRRANHRRRRKGRVRYRQALRHGQPFKLRRPSMARSIWGSTIRKARGKTSASRTTYTPHIFRWRGEAIARVVLALCDFVPISQVVILEPNRSTAPSIDKFTPSERRQQLIEAYGAIDKEGKRVPRCVYCGTVRGQIEADHLLPQARGGTDAWDNLVLACIDCNAKKGARLPDEASMTFAIQLVSQPPRLRRAHSYAEGTARQLVQELGRRQMQNQWLSSGSSLPHGVPQEVWLILQALYRGEQSLSPVVARAIPRPRKQKYTSHNYPLSVSLLAGRERLSRVVKRRVRINQELRVKTDGERAVIRVRRPGDEVSEEVEQVIRIGMLCEGLRAGHSVVGIVAAIHSDGRLGLDVLSAASAQEVNWRRVVVSPRKHLRVVSISKVLFVRI